MASILNSFLLSFILILICSNSISSTSLSKLLVSAAATASDDDCTENEIQFSHSLDWCIGDDDHPILHDLHGVDVTL